MWITSNSDSTVAQWNADILGDLVDDPVAELPGDGHGLVWNDGAVQVTQDIGERLIESYDDIQPYEAETDESTADESNETES